MKTFEDAVIDRLFALNAQRAAEERVLGAGTSAKKGKRAPKAAPKLPKKSRKGMAQEPLPAWSRGMVECAIRHNAFLCIEK